MTAQPSLFDEALVGPVCSYGVAHALGEACAGCAAETERAIAAFHAAVASAVYDAQGYTPAERREQQRRAREKAL